VGVAAPQVQVFGCYGHIHTGKRMIRDGMLAEARSAQRPVKLRPDAPVAKLVDAADLKN
jgi:hypothetical protein